MIDEAEYKIIQDGKSKIGRDGYGEDAQEERRRGAQQAAFRGVEARGHFRKGNQRLAQGGSSNARVIALNWEKYIEGLGDSLASIAFVM